MNTTNYRVHEVTISAGSALSAAVQLGDRHAVGIEMPGAWTAANLTFQASADGSTYRDLYDDSNNEYAVNADADRYLILNPADFAGIRFLKIRSGTSSSPVNQSAQRTLKLVMRTV